MADVIEKARKRLATLVHEAEQIRAFIQMYERLEAEESGTQGGAHEATRATRATPPTPESRPASPPVASFSKASPAEIIAAAKELMLEKQRPLTRSELVKLLTLRGLRIAGTDKSKNVGTIIWRSKEFENVEGKGYWPKECGAWPGSPLLLD